MKQAIATLASLLSLSSLLSAELVIGRVVDHLGNGVHNVDIDVDNLGSGGDPDVFNDGTDFDGFFSMTVSEFGVFDIIFNGPPPGAAAYLTARLQDIFVAGTIDIGTIVLPPGVALSGRIVDENGIPASNVNIDIIDEATGQRLITPFDRTDLFGNFNVAVPAAPIEARFDATTVPLVTLASQRRFLSPTVNTNLGDVVLPPGAVITGTVRRTTGGAVANADLDFTDNATFQTLYTPHDNTNSLGNFSVVVPVGTFDIQVCPMPGTLLVSQEIDSVPVTTSMDLGILNLEPGFVLSGTVTRSNGAPAGGVDIDVEDSVTGSTIALCVDNTNAAGFYSIIVPIGTFDITFTKRCSANAERVARLTGVVVTGNQTLNATLPAGPCSPVRQSVPGSTVSVTAFSD